MTNMLYIKFKKQIKRSITTDEVMHIQIKAAPVLTKTELECLTQCARTKIRSLILGHEL
jgi:hypothetical protein